MICETCGNLIEDCECERDEDQGPLSDDIGETDYDGDGI
jgi:hypothetical protein